MPKSKIEWTDRTWNVVTGCAKVSEGCRNCYAETMAKRFWKGRKFTDVQCHPERLNQIRTIKKPSKIFVNSMSDLFHSDVPFEFIAKVFIEMLHPENKKHTFQVLTKRPERMGEFINQFYTELAVTYHLESPEKEIQEIPLDFITNKGRDNINQGLANMVGSNVWLGVTVENQKAADERIPIFAAIPAAVKFLSVEPMLGLIDLFRFHFHDDGELGMQFPFDWVICGGESGRKARPMHPVWVRDLRDQCSVANIPFYFKQWGEYITASQCSDDVDFEKAGHVQFVDGIGAFKVGKKLAGCLLDGREWKEYPDGKINGR